MDIKDKVIDVFENRIMQLITIIDLRQLPKWDDADVLGAECLLKEYRRITSAIHSDGEDRCKKCGHQLEYKCPQCALFYP